MRDSWSIYFTSEKRGFSTFCIERYVDQEVSLKKEKEDTFLFGYPGRSLVQITGM